MADNVPITAGSGTNIATDDVGGVHYQRFKVDGGGDGAAAPILGDSTNGLDVDVTRQLHGSPTRVTAAWTSATSVDTALALAVAGYSVAKVTLNPTSTFTGGAIIFEVSDDGGTTYYTINAARLDSGNIESTYTIVASTKVAWTVDVSGFTHFRVRLNPAITGTGTANLAIVASSASIIRNVIAAQATAANLKVDASGVAVPVTDNSGSLTTDATGTTAHDSPGTSVNPLAIGGYASATVPSDVSTDVDVVRAWMLKNGAQVVFGAPHVGFLGNPYTLTSKTVTASTAQTGTAIWTPASGKKVVITSIQIQAGGTTAATVQVWFEGSNGDTTYTRGTDLAIFDGEFAPSSTNKPGFAQTGLWIGNGADFDLRYTTSAGITITITVWGYEI